MIDDGKQVGGVWLPATETHLEDMMVRNPKGVHRIGGIATYQHKKLARCLALLPHDRRRVAVDIGAHVGLWSMWLVGEFMELHAFEPVPLHRDLFARNLAGREYVLHACALGEHAGEVSIQVPLQTTGNAHVAIAGRHPGTRFVADPDEQYLVEQVPLSRLDDFPLRDVDFLKVDVEGVERAVIAGGEQTIRRDRPLICVEQKGNDSAYGDAPRAAVALLQSWGARVLDEISGDVILGWG